MTGRNFIRVEQKLPHPIAILIAFTALYIVLIIRFNIFSFSYAKLVILLLRSKKKAGKSGNMMNFFFQNQENAGESGSIVALRELSQKDKFATVLQYYSFILKGVLFPNFILYYIYI